MLQFRTGSLAGLLSLHGQARIFRHGNARVELILHLLALEVLVYRFRHAHSPVAEILRSRLRLGRSEATQPHLNSRFDRTKRDGARVGTGDVRESTAVVSVAVCQAPLRWDSSSRKESGMDMTSYAKRRQALEEKMGEGGGHHTGRAPGHPVERCGVPVPAGQRSSLSDRGSRNPTAFASCHRSMNGSASSSSSSRGTARRRRGPESGTGSTAPGICSARTPPTPSIRSGRSCRRIWRARTMSTSRRAGTTRSMPLCGA